VLNAIILFAQQPRPKGAEAGAAGALIGIAVGCCYLLIIAVIVGIVIWGLVAAFQALKAVSPRNRDMEPGMVFLHFIPFFGMVWDFFIVFRVASSLQKEFDDRDLSSDGDFGQTLGLWALILSLVGCVPINGILAIMWINRIRGYTARLNRRSSRDVDDEDED
jgi:hypothetical protein